MLLKTRGADPQLVSCKVAGRSHDVRESCRRANMEEKTALTSISSHEVPGLVPAVTTRATRLGAHNPVCDSCMCDLLTGRHGPARWQPVELPCITQSTFTPTIVGNVYHPTWGVLVRTGARFPYCGAKTEAGSPKWSPAAARPLPGRSKRGLQVCMSRTRWRRLETATGFRVL